MPWFTSTQTFTETIWSESPPEVDEHGVETKAGVGDTAEVTLRSLNAGDQADIQDILRMEIAGDDSDRSQLAIGSMRRMSVERSVLSWTIPGPAPTPESIRALAPSVFEQIYSYVRLGDQHPTSPQAVIEPTNGGVTVEGNGSSSLRPTLSAATTESPSL